MENQGQGLLPDAQPQQPQSSIPPVPGYPPPHFPMPPQPYPPTYQQAYPSNGQAPGYFTLPSPGLPPSQYPLHLANPRNNLASVSIVLGALAGLGHFVIYGSFYQSYVHANTRGEVANIYQHLAIFSSVVVLIALGSGTCAIMAFMKAKVQAWNGLIPAMIGLIVSSLFLLVTLDEIMTALIASNALSSLI